MSDAITLTPEEQKLLDILTDSILWAKIEFNWDARWYQEEILRPQSRKIVVRAGRRAGKTDALVIKALHCAYIQPNRDFSRIDEDGKSYYRVLYVAPYESQVNEFFGRLRELIARSANLKASIVRDVKNPHEIQFANGTIIKGMSAGSKSGKGASNVRGQPADVLIMDEADYLADKDISTLLGIILEDPERIWMIAASTPSGRRSYFYRWCTNKKLGWTAFHYPSWVNPNWSESMEQELRDELPGEAFKHEVEAEFGEAEYGVYQHQFIDLALALGKELELVYGKPEQRNGPRVLGVDWDKTSAATNMVAFEFHAGLGLYIPLLRKEIPRGEFTLDNAVKAIIELHREYDFDFIYVDRGYGEHQVETLRRYGLEHPETGLHKKVVGVAFNETVKVVDPHTRKPDKKPAKPWMVNNSVVIFERGKIALNPKDTAWVEQLREYRVVRHNSLGAPVYNDEDEHIIDAQNLALWGLVANFTDLIKSNPGRAIGVVSNVVARSLEKRPPQGPVPVRSGLMPRRSLGRGIAELGLPGRGGPLSRAF